MKHEITAIQIAGASGWEVLVRLAVEPEEHVDIYKNGMQSVVIVPLAGQENLTFGDFYDGGDNIYLEHCRSAFEANKRVAQIKKGFEEFEGVLAANRRGVSTDDAPWNFFDDLRFMHLNLVADTGTGKTTLLSALINEDLDKVARGEASILVIDSQNEHLSWYLPHLARFAPGGDLEGKLIYLEPDLLHPLALNLFDFKGVERMDPNEQMEVLRTVEHALTFFIGGGFGELSGHMQNVIGYCLRALAHIPNATVFTFKELLAMDEKKFAAFMAANPELKNLDPRILTFLEKDMHKKYATTINAMWTRLDSLTKDPFFAATFSHPDNKVDLYELLNEPHVIVVNTNHKRLGDDTTQAFGRFFLASLLRVVRKRAQTHGLPVYCYCDEAQQYISREDAVAALINEARRQYVSLCLSYHRTSDIDSEKVKQALKSANIQITQGLRRGRFFVTTRGQERVEVQCPLVNFETARRMAPEHWDDILADMHARFSYPPTKPVPAMPPKRHSVAIIDGATSTR